MRTIVIGDVHGCLDELLALFEKVNVQSDDRVIFVGDLVDRGPKVMEVLGFVSTRGYEVAMGNHEEKHLRYESHEVAFRASGKKNPMKLYNGSRLGEHEGMVTLGVFGWMSKFPLWIRFNDGGVPWIVTHAGIPSNKPIEEQEMGKLIRTRWVDKETGSYRAADEPDTCPEGAIYWAHRWRGPESVVHGHIVQDDVARIDGMPGDGGALCYGIDTGCCYGGFLTAAVFTGRGRPALYTVQAAREYFPRRRQWPRVSHT